MHISELQSLRINDRWNIEEYKGFLFADTIKEIDKRVIMVFRPGANINYFEYTCSNKSELEALIKGLKLNIDWQLERKHKAKSFCDKEREHFRNPFYKNEILWGSHGSMELIVVWYKVVDVLPRSIVIKQLKEKKTPDKYAWSLGGLSEPTEEFLTNLSVQKTVRLKYDGNTIRYYVVAYPKIAGFPMVELKKWNKEPKRYTDPVNDLQHLGDLIDEETHTQTEEVPHGFQVHGIRTEADNNI